MTLYVVTCVRLVCDVFRSVEPVGAYPTEAAAALAMAAHAVRSGVGVPDGGDGERAVAEFWTPPGDRGDRHVYCLAAVPTVA